MLLSFNRASHLILYHFSFFPLSGLNLAPVARLRTTWEKLPNKYEKLFQDLQDLFDPSRNMAKYRNVLNSQNLQPPIIPLFPVIKKDLTFLHEGKYTSWKVSVSTGGSVGWTHVIPFSFFTNYRQWLQGWRAGQFWEAKNDCERNPSRWPNGLCEHGPCPHVQDSVSVSLSRVPGAREGWAQSFLISERRFWIHPSVLRFIRVCTESPLSCNSEWLSDSTSGTLWAVSENSLSLRHCSLTMRHNYSYFSECWFAELKGTIDSMN